MSLALSRPPACLQAAAVSARGVRPLAGGVSAGLGSRAAAAGGARVRAPPSRRRSQASPLLAASAGQQAAGSSGGSSAGDGSANNAVPAPRKMRGSASSPVPDIDAQHMLSSLGLDGAAQPAALLTSLRQLNGKRQQGVLDNAAAVVAHLLSPAVGLTQEQVGQLLEGCPALFSWPPEERAAVLFGQLMEAGVPAHAAAACFAAHPSAANSRSFAAGIAELAAILAHSEDLGVGPKPDVPAAQRTVAALLCRVPRAVQLVCFSAGGLQQRAAQLQQAGLSAAHVARLTWSRPEFLRRDSAALLARGAVVLQQVLCLTPEQVLGVVMRSKPTWLTLAVETLRERAAALAEGFGKPAAAGLLIRDGAVLEVEPGVWQRNLCHMAACDVASPKAVLQTALALLKHNHDAPSFLQRRLLLERSYQLTAAQLYPGTLSRIKVQKLAQRLLFLERGQAAAGAAGGGNLGQTAGGNSDQPALTIGTVTGSFPNFLEAAGLSEHEWEAWAAANPADAYPPYRWAQKAAEEEARRLAAALPAELVRQERPSLYRWRSKVGA